MSTLFNSKQLNSRLVVVDVVVDIDVAAAALVDIFLSNCCCMLIGP